MKKIIVVVPCYNEAEALPLFIKSLRQSLSSIKGEYLLDVLLVDDGSSDNTFSVIKDQAQKNPNIYYRKFAYNAGHQSALRAGIDSAKDYDAAIMLDSDLQHPPELIPQMLEAWEGGATIVQMVREDSAKEAGFIKYITSRGYYYFINRLSDLQLEYGASDFRLIDKSVIGALRQSREQDLFLRGYFSWLKVSREVIKYSPNKRIAGESKYSFKKMMDLAYRGILQFSEKPLQIAMTIGIIVAFLSFIYGVLLIIRHWAGDYTVSGWTSLMVVMAFCFGINFILLGIIGTYLAHSIRIEKQRPEYIVEEERLPNHNRQSIKA